MLIQALGVGKDALVVVRATTQLDGHHPLETVVATQAEAEAVSKGPPDEPPVARLPPRAQRIGALAGVLCEVGLEERQSISCPSEHTDPR